jgi:sigma-54 dependent transcriptional regulator, acetoin dehydrogenase operon transcriptional activator AcoR
MHDPTTGAMQNFRPNSNIERGDPRAALVLLYAENFAELEPAYLLRTDAQVLGRDENADIVIPVTAVSRRHAEVRAERGRFLIRDLGSTNGVIVDGQRVDEAELETNAEVRIGDAIFKFVESGGGDYQRYRLDGTVQAGKKRLFPASSPLVGGYEMDRLSSALDQIAGTNVSVLVLGESGTGKEVTARFLHDQSKRSGEFHAVNCAALPENLIESELFGYKRGAFSGADRDKIGLIQAAHRGTLLLDEIGDMPLFAQAKLLRVLQAREVVPVGSTKPEAVDVRVVAATHRDLERMLKEGRFRRDLFARLNEFSVHLPPLRDRKEDIFMLVRTFLARVGRQSLTVSLPFMAALLHHDWPYNVRELESAMKRAAALADGPRLTELSLPESVQESILDYARGPRPKTQDTPGEEELRRLLSESGGNIAEVGRRLGKARMQVHRWLRKYGIDMADYRP